MITKIVVGVLSASIISAGGVIIWKNRTAPEKNQITETGSPTPNTDQSALTSNVIENR